MASNYKPIIYICPILYKAFHVEIHLEFHCANPSTFHQLHASGRTLNTCFISTAKLVQGKNYFYYFYFY